MGNGLKWNGKSQRREGAHEIGGFYHVDVFPSPGLWVNNNDILNTNDHPKEERRKRRNDD